MISSVGGFFTDRRTVWVLNALILSINMLIPILHGNWEAVIGWVFALAWFWFFVSSILHSDKMIAAYKEFLDAAMEGWKSSNDLLEQIKHASEEESEALKDKIHG